MRRQRETENNNRILLEPAHENQNHTKKPETSTGFLCVVINYSKLVSFFHKVDRKILHYFECFIFVQPMLCHQPSQKRAIDPSGHIVSRRNREKRTCIVVKPTVL